MERRETAKILEKSWSCYHQSDTRKRDLVSKVYHACRLDLPFCSTKEQDDAQIKARRKEKLFIDRISLPLPEELENWVSGSHNFPDMKMNDIELYLSKSNDRKSAKEGKNLYESGHVSEVEYNNISDCLKFCYVRENKNRRKSEHCVGLPEYYPGKLRHGLKG